MAKNQVVLSWDQAISGVINTLQLFYPGITGDDVCNALKDYHNRKNSPRTPAQQASGLLKREEAAKRLKVSLPTVNRMLNDGRLKRTWLGSRRLVRITEESVEAVIANGCMEVPHNGH